MPVTERKLKFAFYWGASCGGCEIAVLDIDEKILDVAAAADILFWPVAVDTKYSDVEAMEDGFIDVCFFNGAIRTSEQEELAHLLRRKSGCLVAFGSCAAMGGIPGLANLANRDKIFETAYLDNPSTSNPGRTLPSKESRVKEGTLTLPEFHDRVRALHQVTDVDYFLPGCPPPTNLILEAVNAVIKGELPPKGSVIAPEKSVCEECRFEKSEKMLTEIRRIYEVEKVEDRCLLEQGIICLGPATRGGCSARCLDAYMPCTGCGGPTPNSMDQGGKMISALASILGLEGEEALPDEEIERLLDGIVDPVGTFYKYGLAAALINRRLEG
ncbi:MAG: oxidoreductase [Thermoplasmata archaeon]|nr:MAG: oxidoreductase [Thermoplasmatales archaeon ex4484_6]RLF58788.1 MAG: oxidoreductase [Thermoplasmata archaeon]RLF65488.1 MAG: oxidoreductase [Thermoplasmata archaeon]